MTHYDAGLENVQRVASTLAAAGWPLAGVTGVDVSEAESESAAAS
jgi:hypothetical protein